MLYTFAVAYSSHFLNVYLQIFSVFLSDSHTNCRYFYSIPWNDAVVHRAFVNNISIYIIVCTFSFENVLGASTWLTPCNDHTIFHYIDCCEYMCTQTFLTCSLSISNEQISILCYTTR